MIPYKEFLWVIASIVNSINQRKITNTEVNDKNMCPYEGQLLSSVIKVLHLFNMQYNQFIMSLIHCIMGHTVNHTYQTGNNFHKQVFLALY